MGSQSGSSRIQMWCHGDIRFGVVLYVQLVFQITKPALSQTSSIIVQMMRRIDILKSCVTIFPTFRGPICDSIIRYETYFHMIVLINHYLAVSAALRRKCMYIRMRRNQITNHERGIAIFSNIFGIRSNSVSKWPLLMHRLQSFKLFVALVL